MGVCWPKEIICPQQTRKNKEEEGKEERKKERKKGEGWKIQWCVRPALRPLGEAPWRSDAQAAHSGGGQHATLSDPAMLRAAIGCQSPAAQLARRPRPGCAVCLNFCWLVVWACFLLLLRLIWVCSSFLPFSCVLAGLYLHLHVVTLFFGPCFSFVPCDWRLSSSTGARRALDKGRPRWPCETICRLWWAQAAWRRCYSPAHASAWCTRT